MTTRTPPPWPHQPASVAEATIVAVTTTTRKMVEEGTIKALSPYHLSWGDDGMKRVTCYAATLDKSMVSRSHRSCLAFSTPNLNISHSLFREASFCQHSHGITPHCIASEFFLSWGGGYQSLLTEHQNPQIPGIPRSESFLGDRCSDVQTERVLVRRIFFSFYFLFGRHVEDRSTFLVVQHLHRIARAF